MVAAYLTDQKYLLDAAFKFAWDNKGKLVETHSMAKDNFNKSKETTPKTSAAL